MKLYRFIISLADNYGTYCHKYILSILRAKLNLTSEKSSEAETGVYRPFQAFSCASEVECCPIKQGDVQICVKCCSVSCK